MWSQRSRSDGRALQEFVCGWSIRDAHVPGVILNLLPGPQRDDAEEHHLGELRRVLDRAGDLRLALRGLSPVHLVVLVADAGQLLRRLADRVVQRFRQQARILAVGVVHQLALAADENRAAGRVERFFADLDRLRRQQTAVVPGELDRRLAAARRELVHRHRRVREADAVERRRHRFDRRRVAEIERPQRVIDQVRAHVADRADAPVDPAAPVERVIHRVIVDARRDAEEQIPVERRRLRVIPGHRVREPRFDAGAVPAESFRRRRAHFRTRNALRPVTERTIGPDVDLADVADRAGPDVLDRGSRVVPRVPLVAHLRRQLRHALRLAGELARLGNRPAQWLLHVDVLAEVHRRERDRRVHVVGCRDDDAVDVFLLVEHVAVVAIAPGARQRLLQRLHARDRRRHPLAFERRQRHFRPALRVEAYLTALLAVEPSLLVGDVGVEAGEALVGVVPVDVAQRDDVLGREVDEIAAALTADADGGDVEAIARRSLAASEDVARDDRQPGAGERHVGHEITAADLFRHVILDGPAEAGHYRETVFATFATTKPYDSGRIRMFLNASTPAWSPCSPMCPRFARPNFGHALNLVDATFASQSGLHSSYSTIFTSFSQCSTCAPLATMRALFHSPTGFRCPAGDGYRP